MHAYRAYGKNYTDFRTLATWLGSGEEFKNSNNTFRGVRGQGTTYTGDLPQEYRDGYLYAYKRNRINYVVYSYNTPIAWHVTTKLGGVWVQPDVKYSNTTTTHQGKLAVALSNLQKAFAL